MKIIPALVSSIVTLALVPAAFAARPSTVATRYPSVIVDATESREVADAQRLAVHAQATVEAQRELTAAHLEVKVTRARWDHAVHAGHPDAAGVWAQRHARAVARERAATGRLLDERAERNLAFADLRLDLDQLWRLEVAPRNHRA